MFKKILLCVFTILIFYNITVGLIQTRNSLEPTYAIYDIDEQLYQNSTYEQKLTHNQIKQKLEKELNLHLYILIQKPLKNNCYGYCRIGVRIIVVTENLSYIDYIWTLAHEMIHLKHLTSNETWTNFETFKLLYNSEESEFRAVACIFGNRYLTNFYWNNREYNIGYYIKNWLQNGLTTEPRQQKCQGVSNGRFGTKG